MEDRTTEEIKNRLDEIFGKETTIEERLETMDIYISTLDMFFKELKEIGVVLKKEGEAKW